MDNTSNENQDRPLVGRTSATERQPTTSDDFSFWLGPEVIANPFDIVEVEQVVPPSKTYGLITTIDHFTDAASSPLKKSFWYGVCWSSRGIA